MDIRDMAGQMIMDIENAFEFPVNIGAYFIGASDPPIGNTPPDWREHQNELQDLSGNTSQRIPLIMATDAVHGQNIVQGATIFPHNIGLGATRNADLVKRIAQVTAAEMNSTGLDMTFAPTLAVVRTMTWGRT
jgi:beta-glucosidase